MSTASGKKLSVFIAALSAGVACVVSFVPLSWLIGNSYGDPAAVFAEGANFSIYEEVELYLMGGLGAVTAFLFLFSSARITAGATSRGYKVANQFAVAVWFAVSMVNFQLVAEEINSSVRTISLLHWNSYYVVLLVLSLGSLFIWTFITRRWTGLETSRCGLRYAANGAIAVLLISFPSHVVAVSDGTRFLAGIGTFMATYFSAQVLFVVGVCGLWMRRHAPREETTTDHMHEAASRYALRESVTLASAAFFLLILSYSIYPFFYRDRFIVAMQGQNGFCVFAVCAVARGIKGYLLRGSRPFWILGLYMLLAEVALLVAWKLVAPAVV